MMEHLAGKNAAPPPAAGERALLAGINTFFLLLVNEKIRNNNEFMKLGH